LEVERGALPKSDSLLGGTVPRSFKPEAAALQSRVLECAVRSLQRPHVSDQDFDFAARQARDAGRLAAELQRTAACHPKTRGKELAVVLADPVGYATELNALRLRRFELAKQELAQPHNAHPMASLQMLDGLRQGILDLNAERQFEAVSPVMSEGLFNDKLKAGLWPRGTRWRPLVNAEAQRRHGPGKGHVIFPDHEARANAWLRRQTAATFERYRKYVDEEAITSWKQAFEKRMHKEHGLPQQRFEEDWWGMRKDARFASYFEQHFNEQDPNPPLISKARCSAGAVYMQEVHRAMVPQPLSDGKLQEEYLAELSCEISKPEALMWRALVGNQAELFEHVQGYLTSTRQDKLHDLSAGLFTQLKPQLGVTDAKFSWLLHACYGVSTLGITQSWSAALSAVLGASKLAQDSRVDRMANAAMLAQTLAMARESALQGGVHRVPLRVGFELDWREGSKQLRERYYKGLDAITAAHQLPEPQRREALAAANERLRGVPSDHETLRMAKEGKGKLRFWLATDTHEMQALGKDVRSAIAQGVGSMSTSPSANAAMFNPKGTLMATEAQLELLLSKLPSRHNQAAQALASATHLVRGGALSLEGHVGLLGVLINGWGFIGNARAAWGSTDALAWANTLDSLFGLVAGGAQLAEAALSASITHRLGAEAVKSALPILGLRAITAGAGMVCGFAMLAGQLVKAGRARNSRDDVAFYAYSASATAVGGLAATSTVIFVGAFSEFMVARGAKAAIWQTGATFSARVGAGLALRTGLGLTGWGLIFLGAGLAFEFYALQATPDAVQTHVRRSYFGKGPGRYGSYPDEFEALEALKQAQPPAAANDGGGIARAR